MQKDSYKIVSYKIKHNYSVDDFLLNYRLLLQKAIDIIWKNIMWIEKQEKRYYVVENGGEKKIRKYYYVKRLIPLIPKTREFKN